jgi:predicted HTH domain antitoxin
MKYNKKTPMTEETRRIAEIKTELWESWYNGVLDKKRIFELWNELYHKSLHEGFYEAIEEGRDRAIITHYQEKNITKEEAIAYLGITPSEFELLLKKEASAPAADPDHARKGH